MLSFMPEGVQHFYPKLTSYNFFFKHFIYYFFLLFSSMGWKKKKCVIRVFGVNLPVLFLLKFFSEKKIVVSYQFDWAEGVKKDYKGIKPFVSGFVQRSAINASDYLICTTQWLADIAQKRYKYNPERISIIPNYVNLEIFNPDSVKKRQIVFAGRLHWSKGINVLIKAFKKFQQEYKEYVLIIIGIGEEEHKLKTQANGNSSILFTGGIPNSQVAKYFNESEIFVLPTMNMEGHPKALIEAMAAGCKSIASDVPGNNHVLYESNSSEFLFKAGNSEDLYEKLVYAKKTPAKNQYDFAIAKYSSVAFFEKEFSILKSLIV